MFANILLTLFFLFTIACAPAKKEIQISPSPASSLPSSPSPQKPKKRLIQLSNLVPTAELEKRIEQLNILLQKPDLSEQKSKEIKEIINTYSIIKGMGEKGYIDQKGLKAMINILLSSFQKLEGKYVLALQKRPVNISNILESLSQKRQKIIQDYKEGRYMDVVNQCLELKLRYGGYVIGPALDTIFAISLGEIGMIREAIDTGEKVLQEMALIPQRDILKERLKEWKRSIEETGVPSEEEKGEEAIPEKKEEKVDINFIIISAKRLIEQENFEQALAILNGSKIEDSKEIEELKNKAVEGIINRERNKAAKLFLLARESKDLEKKREYLKTAFRILEALIIQYPDSPFMDRIKENLNKVSEELQALPTAKTPISQ